MRKLQVKILSVTILLVLVSIVFTLVLAEEPKVTWEYAKGGMGMGVVRDASFEEVWNKTQDILFFEKFKPKGAVWKHTFEPISVEKTSGLVSVKGFCRSSFLYTFKIIVREKEGQIIVKTQCNSSWKKRVTQKFWQLLEEGL